MCMFVRVAPALFGVGDRPQLATQRGLATLVPQPFRLTERAEERRTPKPEVAKIGLAIDSTWPENEHFRMPRQKM